jgi:hypothetical protein
VYGRFSMCLIHKEGLCRSSAVINRVMMKEDLYYWRSYR